MLHNSIWNIKHVTCKIIYNMVIIGYYNILCIIIIIITDQYKNIRSLYITSAVGTGPSPTCQSNITHVNKQYL